MKVKTLKLGETAFPQALVDIADPPDRIYWAGIDASDVLSKPRVAVVGSRKATNYGRLIADGLAGRLAASGVVIISGLAFGVDSYAHKAALEAGGCTVAVLPSPLEAIYPASHRNLAQQIINKGGALASEYSAGTPTLKVNFIARNRLVSALADVLLITEAARNSGSLHTARFALEQGKTVMAVPGNINSPVSEGCNNLIKSGAVPVTNVDDVFFALGYQPKSSESAKRFNGTDEQRLILNLIGDGVEEQEELALASKLSTPQVNSNLTILELKGYIRPAGAGRWNAV